MIASPPAVFRTRNGMMVRALVRDETTDWNTVAACVNEDEYGLSERSWSGVALDIGAHIGGATLALLADNPELRVVAVEALPANAELLRENVALNGFDDRVTIHGAAASCYSRPTLVAYGATDNESDRWHRFIGGNVWRNGPRGEQVEVPGVTLEQIVAEVGEIAVMKIDCEGCEWDFLASPALASVVEIRGEGHPTAGHTLSDIRGMLEATHDVTFDEAQTWGPFRAVRR
jgi:FkbM family methyltransferase